MSLTQQGSQTARNRNTKITSVVTQSIVVPSAMMMWNNDAQVLISTCPECGSLVVGFRQPMAMPINAAEFTIRHSSIKPIWSPLLGRSSSVSPR